MDIKFVVGYEHDIYAPRLAGRIGATAIPVTTKVQEDRDLRPDAKATRFDDGETKTTVGFNSRIIEGENMVMTGPYDIAGENVIMVARNTRPPKNPAEHTMNNLFVLDTLARREPSRLFFFQPYMHYARQDKEFLGGESWSLKTIAKMYEACRITDFTTINSHLYGKESDADLQSFFESAVVHDLGPERLFADYLKANELVVEDPVIVGPDEGSLKMIKELAECFEEGEYVCIAQKRDHHTGVKEILDVPTDISKVKGRTAIVYDDLTWSGKTIYDANQALKPHEPKSVYAAVAHLVNQGAARMLIEAGLDGVLYTNSLIRHEDSEWFRLFGDRMHEIDTVPLVADYIKSL